MTHHADDVDGLTEVNTENDFMLATNGTTMSFVFPVAITTRAQAYRTAAWILAMCEVLPPQPELPEFDVVLEAVRNT